MELNWGQLHKDTMTVLTGEFPVVVTASTAVQSSTGKPMIKVTLKIESGQYAGRSLYSQFVVSADSPNAMRMFFSHMGVLGLTAAFFERNPTMDEVAAALENRRATAVVAPRTWQGAERESIEGWKPALGGPGGNSLATPLGGLVAASTPPSQPAATTAEQLPLGAQPATEAPAPPF